MAQARWRLKAVWGDTAGDYFPSLFFICTSIHTYFTLFLTYSSHSPFSLCYLFTITCSLVTALSCYATLCSALRCYPTLCWYGSFGGNVESVLSGIKQMVGSGTTVVYEKVIPCFPYFRYLTNPKGDLLFPLPYYLKWSLLSSTKRWSYCLLIFPFLLKGDPLFPLPSYLPPCLPNPEPDRWSPPSSWESYFSIFLSFLSSHLNNFLPF